MHTVDVLIIGAGPTGIGAALRAQELGLDWLMVEAGNRAGGMAVSVQDGGYTWDLGGHVLHSHFREFDDAVAKTETPMRPVLRNGRAWMRGQLYRTPVQHFLQTLPTDLAPDAPAANLTQYFVNQFGEDLAQRFFIPFQEKMWAHPTDQICHSWTSQRSGSAARNVPMLTDKPVPPATFPYPVGGTGQLWSALADQLDQDRIRYRTAVLHLNAAQRVAHLSDGQLGGIHYAQCVSSMPLPTLLNMTRTEHLHRADKLAASSALLVGLGIPGEPPETWAERSWIYCPDREVAWHRATVMSNYNPSGVPADHWSVLFEFGMSKHRRLTREQAVSSAVLSLDQLGVDVLPDHRFLRKLPFGYPVPTLGRDDVLAPIDATLRGFGIRSRGRFGGWRYESCNSDYSFMQGRQAIDAACHGVVEDVYWRPEIYS